MRFLAKPILKVKHKVLWDWVRPHGTGATICLNGLLATVGKADISRFRGVNAGK